MKVRNAILEKECSDLAKERDLELDIWTKGQEMDMYKHIKESLGNIEILEFPEVVFNNILGRVSSLGLNLYQLNDSNEQILGYFYITSKVEFGRYLNRVPIEKRAYYKDMCSSIVK